MADLEEGEIADSDSEVSATPSINKNGCNFGQSSSTPPKVPNTNTYRFTAARDSPVHSFRGAQNNDNSSDDSADSSDEDSPLWNCKRTKYLNRLKMEGVDMSSRSNSPLFINPLLENHGSSPVLRPPPQKKKVNNIWGSVLQEQTLTQTMVGFSVDKEDDIDVNAQDRSVESYNYKNAKDDTRPFPCVNDDDAMDKSDDELFSGVVDLEPDDTLEKERMRRKRKRPVKARLGQNSDLNRLGAKMKRNYKDKGKGSAKNRLGSGSGRYRFDDIPTRDGPRPTVNVTDEDPVTVVVDAICLVLDEPKSDLITRVVKRLGQKKCIHLLRMTEDIEDNGGMMIKDGSRRRSAGGVYLQLLKADAEVTKADTQYIFEDNDKNFQEEMKRRNAEKKARRRRLQRQKKEELRQRMADQNGGVSHMSDGEAAHAEGGMQVEHSNNSNSLDRDTDDSDECSEGEITPDSCSENDQLEKDDAGRGDLGDKATGGRCDEEDMLMITVGDGETIE